MPNDSSTPFDEDNLLPLPDKPGTWLYQATQMPVTVIRKDDGELYFQGGSEGQEEMKVSAFGTMKAAHPELSKMGFFQIHPVLDVQISPN